MNRETELLDLYERWRRLTSAEAGAIQGRDWAQLARCQGEKEAISLELARLQEIVLRDLRPAARRETFAARLRSLLLELVALQSQNTRLLATRLERLGEQRCELQQASRSLHRVRQAYSPEARPLWHSYS